MTWLSTHFDGFWLLVQVVAFVSKLMSLVLSLLVSTDQGIYLNGLNLSWTHVQIKLEMSTQTQPRKEKGRCPSEFQVEFVGLVRNCHTYLS